MEKRICITCNIEKSLKDDFHKAYNDSDIGKVPYYANSCKLCKNLQRRKMYELEKIRITPEEIEKSKIKAVIAIKTLTCNKCNETKDANQFYYNRARYSYAKSCKKCNTKICGAYQKTKKTDMVYITQTRAAELRRRCKIEGISFDENLKEILREKWISQEGNCFYTGIPMICSNEYHTNNYVMTVDRIDPTQGYTKDNIALCCSIVNRMKQNLSLAQLKDLCKRILEE